MKTLIATPKGLGRKANESLYELKPNEGEMLTMVRSEEKKAEPPVDMMLMRVHLAWSL